MDLQFAERLAKAFEAKYPGIAVRVEGRAPSALTRSIRNTLPTSAPWTSLNTLHQAHCIIWKRNGWFMPYLPEEVVKHLNKRDYDAEGFDVTTRILISPIAYNTNLVKKEDGAERLQGPARPEMERGKLV